MTIRQAILFVLMISILTSCRHGYKIENDNVYYESWNEGSGQRKRLIEEADGKTFEKLDFDCDCSLDFGKDKNYLFIDGIPIRNIDPNTFKFVGNYIFRDKDSAYFFGFYDNLNQCVIKGVNPDKIKLIKYPWAKADNLLIRGQDTVTLDDIDEFIPIDDNWGKTKKHIINYTKVVYGADVETFKIRSSFQGKDKNYTYEFGVVAEEEFKKASYKTFDFVQKYFCENQPIEFVDIYDSLVSKEDQNNRIEVVEKLKLNGFSISNIGYSNIGESNVITVSLAKDKCDCLVEKFYSYDNSKPSGTKKIFKVTERIRCESKGQ